jgi:hypothetical protein
MLRFGQWSLGAGLFPETIAYDELANMGSKAPKAWDGFNAFGVDIVFNSWYTLALVLMLAISFR